jgi:DNA repair exonuclease SbcCD ATPase subunit
MKQISLTSVQLANFRSFATPTTISFTTRPGLKLITGSNQAEPRLGANGAGKSTIWDAVCFALYGTSVKGLRPSDLLTHGADNLAVALDLTINDEPHNVRRAAPPMRAYLDGGPAEQGEIDALVGLSRSRFLNSVVFGQATPLFIDLPVPARGDLLDEVLDLELWMRAASNAGEQHRVMLNRLIEARRALARTTGQIEGLGDLNRFAVQQAHWEQQRQVMINDAIDALEQAEQAHAAFVVQRDKDEGPVDEAAAKQAYEEFRTAHTTARETVATLNAQIKTITETTELLDNNNTCPTCGQDITTEHVQGYFETAKPQVAELSERRRVALLDIQTTASEVAGSEETWRGAVRINQERRAARIILDRQIADKARDMARLDREATQWTNEANPFAVEAERARQEHARLTELLEQQQAEESVMVSQAAALDYWKQGFRKVRLYCLERVLGELTVETRNSLLALGLGEWRIAFATATETRSGTVRLGVQVNIQAPEAQRRFELLSGGESQRARLAVSLGLANLIQRWAGVRFDLEVFDEPTAWLSDQGVADLLDSLRSRAETNQRSIWVCDHRALVHAGFDEVMNVIKTEAGSRIAP